MTDPASSNVEPRTAEVRSMMDRLEGCARGLGLDEAARRQIIEKVLADMPICTTQMRLTEVRTRMVVGSA
jgi:hypothetical protein